MEKKSTKKYNEKNIKYINKQNNILQQIKNTIFNIIYKLLDKYTHKQARKKSWHSILQARKNF